MLSAEFVKFSDRLRNTPCDNPRRVGYAKLRQLQEDRIQSETCGCSDITQIPAVFNGIQAEWLLPENAPADSMILYIHGGGWSLGSIRQTRLFLAPMVRSLRMKTLHFNYRLMPENPFPAGLDDCLSVYQGLLREGWRPENIALCGESAGANLALALLLRLKDLRLPLPGAASLMSPITFLDSMEGSHSELAASDLILAEDSFVLCDVAELYAPGWDKKNPYLSPLYGDLTGLPPMQLLVGTDELLFDDTIRFYQKSRQAGNYVELIVGDHMTHSWPIFMQQFPEAEEAVWQMSEFLHRHMLHCGKDQQLQYERFLLKKALDEIEYNYPQASLTRVAEAHNQTIYGYSKLIRQFTGMTFKQLLKNKRLSVVERLLRESDQPIKAIAASVGYENPTHFYDLFRKKYGKTPQKYREDFCATTKNAKKDT